MDPAAIVQVISQFDEQCFGFWLQFNGLRVGHIDHFMKPANGGRDTEFRVRLRVGRPGNGLLNYMIPKVSMISTQMLFDWALHNVEESGESEKIIPELRKLPDSAFISQPVITKRRVCVPRGIRTLSCLGAICSGICG